MSAQTGSEAVVEFMLDGPVTVTRSYGPVTITGRRVIFRSYVHGPDAPVPNGEYACATIFADSNDNAEIATWDGGGDVPALPDWCPRPPDGWDAHVRAFRLALEGVTS